MDNRERIDSLVLVMLDILCEEVLTRNQIIKLERKLKSLRKKWELEK